MNNTTLSEALGIRGSEHDPGVHSRWPDQFGIEFEVEGVTAYGQDLMYWTVHSDGSLVNGMEFVLAGPTAGAELEAALREFYEGQRLSANGGLRTSTHIHINGRDLTVDQLRSMIVLTYAIENDLFRYVGENRKWSGYAMGLAELPNQRLSTILSDNNRAKFRAAIHSGRNNERYYGMNVAALLRHGSIEYRHFPGMPSKEETESYLDFVQAIKNAARSLPIEDLINEVTDSDALQALFTRILPGTIRDRLLSMGSAEDRWNAFTEVAALCEQDNKFQRADQLIRLTPVVVNFLVKNKQLTPVAAQYLKKRVSSVGVVTMRDFRSLIDEARQATDTQPPPARGRVRDYRFQTEADDYPDTWEEDEDDDDDESSDVAPPIRPYRIPSITSTPRNDGLRMTLDEYVSVTANFARNAATTNRPQVRSTAPYEWGDYNSPIPASEEGEQF